MRLKFLHAADIHLGYQQYGLPERYDDFSEAFRWVIQTALEERVDFLLIAGDLFEKRTLDPRTLLIAVEQFEQLQAAGIPVVAIEGNHERSYGDSLSWMEYLNQSHLLQLLDCSRTDHGWLPLPWDDAERKGGYLDIAGARIYGLRYQGAQTGAILADIGAALAAAPPSPSGFSVFLSHTSVEGFFDKGHPFTRQQDLSALRQRVDYLALGHIHVPFQGTYGNGEWLFNPGCPETWSSEEWQHQQKGAFLVEVDTSRAVPQQAAVRVYPDRRPFVRIRQELDACPAPGTLLRLLEEKIAREPVPRRSSDPSQPLAEVQSSKAGAAQRQKAPVVEIVLAGVARFSRTEIDLDAIEQLAKKYLDPLIVRVRSSLQEAPTSIEADGELPKRDMLERLVFENLIRADDRFATSAAAVAQITISLKQMVLDGVPADEIAEEVGRRLHAQRQEPDKSNSQELRKSAQGGLPCSDNEGPHIRGEDAPSETRGRRQTGERPGAQIVQQDNLFSAGLPHEEAPDSAK